MKKVLCVIIGMCLVSIFQSSGQTRTAVYGAGNFTFTTPVLMQGPSDVLFGEQDIEPRCASDAAGNIYVAAIQGIPAGTDVWKSTNGGTSFTYLGQPDGAQAASASARGGGAGGGDEDIAVGSTGNVYVASLWLGSITSSASTNGGAQWTTNPVASNVPADDRQWIATHGANEVYLTYQQLGALLSGTSSILVVKSTDGGISFPFVAHVTTPGSGPQPDIQGNIAVDQNNGNVYTVFISNTGNQLYVARSVNGGSSFDLHLARQGAAGVSFENVFPIMAVDRGGNLHVVYSDGANVWLTSSSDQGTTWLAPVQVNNGSATRTALSPWVDAGDAGKVDIMWWGTSASSNLSTGAQWQVFFAQTQNALSATPTILQNAATGVFHTGPICVNGTGCASGTRDLAEYCSTTIYRDGMAMIVYPDDQQTSNPLTYFVKQSGGTGALTAGLAAMRGRGSLEESPSIPGHLSLNQNYPNPFNPSTRITYSIPEKQYVSLKVYTILGREIATLEDRVKDEGSYSITFDRGDLPSGLYIYKLRTGTAVLTRKMLFTK